MIKVNEERILDLVTSIGESNDIIEIRRLALEIVSILENRSTVDMSSKYPYFDLLTLREREIVRLVLSGESNQEIAEELGLSINTVKMHMQNIFIKLGIRRRCQLFNRDLGR